MLPRHLAPALNAALSDTPVVLLVGARQTGKTTLARWLASQGRKARYLTMDDTATLAAAHADPMGFIEGLNEPVILDEIQRSPGLFPAIKVAVDRRRDPGRFLLTGSANVLLLPKLSESLAGRMEVLTLWPFSQGEIEGVREGFIDKVFSGRLQSMDPGESRTDTIARALRGGYPEVMARRASRRPAWFGSYVTTILHREIRDLANVEGLTMLPRLLELLAARSATLVRFAEVSRSAGIPQTTLKRYLALFETTYLTREMRPWSTNVSKRLVKTPKRMFVDTGLLSYLAGWTEKRIAGTPDLAGVLLENFAAMELVKQAGWCQSRIRLFHFRTASGREVDLVLENEQGKIVGIEVKASSSVHAGDFRGLETLREVAPEKFHRGVVLYTGREALPFGKQLHALPLSALWRMGASEA